MSPETESTVHARVTRRFSASPECVFDSWLDPEKVRRWFAPELGEMVRVEVDPRVGGSFSFMQRRDGEDVDHVGEYFEIDRPRRLVFTWGVPPEPSDSRVIIDIVPLETGCELTLIHEMDAEWADYLDRTEDAWARMLDAIAGTIG
jgi:uncharacterized protein YndB with AHSA1/START domain